MRRSLKQVCESGKGSRDNEIVQGWDDYHKIAMKIARRWLSYYFPTNEDLYQAAALAASVVQAKFGEAARMGELTSEIRGVLKQQASAYGMRQRQVRRSDGSKTMQTIRADVAFSVWAGELQAPGDDVKVQDWLESRMMIVGVGEWTRRQATMLYELGR
jgi:hypothetical protein